VAEVLVAWAGRYLREAQAVAAVAQAEEGDVVVAETGKGRFAQLVRVGRHELRADEPATVPGGLDTGPGPYDYLLAGLAPARR
jgi:hypothetical protein